MKAPQGTGASSQLLVLASKAMTCHHTQRGCSPPIGLLTPAALSPPAFLTLPPCFLHASRSTLRAVIP